MVYDGSNIVLTFDGIGAQTHRYLYGTGVDQILADETATGVNWALVDNQGSVRDVIDSNGQVLNHLVYDSYGQVTSETNPSLDFRFGYTGRERDKETGLQYNRARYYDSRTGAFIGQDPIGFGGGDANLYRYVGNSPINATDSSGLFVNILIGAGLGVGFEVAAELIQNHGDYHKLNFGKIAVGGLTGGLTGGLGGLATLGANNLVSRAIINGVLGAAVSAINQIDKNALDNKCNIFNNVGKSALIGGGFSALGSFGGDVYSKLNTPAFKQVIFQPQRYFRGIKVPNSFYPSGQLKYINIPNTTPGRTVSLISNTLANAVGDFSDFF